MKKKKEKANYCLGGGLEESICTCQALICAHGLGFRLALTGLLSTFSYVINTFSRRLEGNLPKIWHLSGFNLLKRRLWSLSSNNSSTLCLDSPDPYAKGLEMLTMKNLREGMGHDWPLVWFAFLECSCPTQLQLPPHLGGYGHLSVSWTYTMFPSARTSHPLCQPCFSSRPCSKDKNSPTSLHLAFHLRKHCGLSKQLYTLCFITLS